MSFDFPSSTDFPVKPPRIHKKFKRVGEFGGVNGSRLKDILPFMARDSVLVLDTNFASPLRSIDLIKILLEQNKSDLAKNVAKYLAHSSYGEMKTIFELAKKGRVISPPYIVREIRRRNEIIDAIVRKDRFGQKGYFNQYYRDPKDVELMRSYTKQLIGMSRTLHTYINRGNLRFLSQINRAQEQAQLIAQGFNLPSKNRVGDKPSLEDIMVACLGINIQGTLCTEDRDCYITVSFLRARSGRSSFYTPPICSSVQRIYLKDDNSNEMEYFPDRFGRFTLQ